MLLKRHLFLAYLVATVLLDKFALAFRALSHLCLTQRFLNFETTFILTLLLHDFLATKGDMRLFTAILA